MRAWLVLTLLVAGPAWSADTPKARRPVLAYWVSHHDVRPPTGKPWRESFVLPRLVAYDDGLVVMTSLDGEASSLTLAERERPALFDAAGDAFLALDKDAYEGTRELHPPVHIVTRWKDGNRKTVRFFGALHEPAQRAKAPAALQATLDTLSSFKPAAAKPYVPEALEVRACHTTAAATQKAWPSGWPQPEDGKKERLPGECFTLTLPPSQRRVAEALLPPGQAFTTIAHRGRTWLVTLTRFVLPAEDAWAGR